jgi:hypothetical protein
MVSPRRLAQALIRLSFIFGVAAIALGSSVGAFARPTTRPQGEDAGSFMRTVVGEKLTRRFDLAWESLYPPHQQVASRTAYVDCESLIPWPGANSFSVRVLRIFHERIRVAGESRKVRTTAVHLRATALASGLPLPFVVEQTFHALRVEGQWKWILSADQYAFYSAGTCPYG